MPTTASNSSGASLPEGVAFLCDPGGDVRTVVVSTLEDGAVAGSLFACLETASLNPCSLFLQAVTTNGFARSTPLRLGTHTLHAFGFRGADALQIVAVIDPGDAAAMAEAAGFGELAVETSRTHASYDLYDELSRVNNELVTAQRELARTVAELRRINEYKNELLGMAAHDLRNPLNVNSAFVDFLLEDAATLSEDNVLLLERIRTSNTFMLRLVEDVLSFSAVEAGHVRLRTEPTSLDEVVAVVVDTMRIVAERKDVTIALHTDPSLPPLPLDRIKLTQAVQNLVSNAVSHSPAGATVDVRVRADGAFAVIEVEDRGSGIPAAELPELFKPFVRLSTARTSGKDRSVGLGLAITRRMVEAHGGRIDVRSVEGEGSTFAIRLPLPR
jgi:signal transduction histidine kinase